MAASPAKWELRQSSAHTSTLCVRTCVTANAGPLPIYYPGAFPCPSDTDLPEQRKSEYSQQKGTCEVPMGSRELIPGVKGQSLSPGTGLGLGPFAFLVVACFKVNDALVCRFLSHCTSTNNSLSLFRIAWCPLCPPHPPKPPPPP